MGTDQNAWKLEDLEVNLTYHYDIATGILIESVSWRSDHSVIATVSKI
ncbi:MAG: hypothetical protein ACFFAE_07585 [Candidatus Hodarchaeota archaeon]